MLEFAVPRLTMLPELKESEKRRRVVLVTVPDGDPFDLIGPMTVLRDTNWQLESSGRPDLGYDIEVVTNAPGSIFEAHGMSIVVQKSCYEIEGPIDTMVFQAVDYEERCLEDRRVHRLGRFCRANNAPHGHCLHRHICVGTGRLAEREEGDHPLGVLPRLQRSI